MAYCVNWRYLESRKLLNSVTVKRKLEYKMVTDKNKQTGKKPLEDEAFDAFSDSTQ